MPSIEPKKSTKITRGGQPVYVRRRVQLKDGKDYVTWELWWQESGTRRNTSRSTREKAMALADEIAVRLARGEINQHILSGTELAQYQEAIKLCSEAGCTLLDAARFYQNQWKKTQMKKIEIPKLITEFLAAKLQDGRSKRYLDDARTRLAKFALKLTGLIDTIATRDVDDYLRGLNVTNRSRNNVHTILGSLFSYARSRGYLPATEKTVMEILQRSKNKPPIIGILKVAEFDAALRAATPKTLAAFVLGGFCGVRQAEICRLDWSAIDFQRKIITVNVDIAKTARRRIVPLPAAAAAWLKLIAKPSGKVITYASPVILSIMMRPVWKAAKANYTQNCLRHSAASYTLALTGDASRTSLDLGTSVQMLMQHYRELVLKEDAEAWFNIFPPATPEKKN